MSVKASVIGPAAILGSSFNACRAAGTLNPKKQAAHKVRKMLKPMLTAARGVPRQSHTIIATVAPQAIPSNNAVPASRQNARKYHANVGRTARNAWIVSVID